MNLDAGIRFSLCGARPSKADARRLKLIEAASVLFAEQGFHNTGIAQIAKASGVLVGQIYRDFASKEDIVAAIVERDLAAFLNDGTLCHAIEANDADAVKAWIVGFIGGKADKDSRLIADILAESSRNPRIWSILQSCQGKVRSSMLTALYMLAPGDAVARRRETLTDTVLTMSAGLLHQRTASGLDIESLTVSLQTILMREIDRLVDLARERVGESVS